MSFRRLILFFALLLPLLSLLSSISFRKGITEKQIFGVNLKGGCIGKYSNMEVISSDRYASSAGQHGEAIMVYDNFFTGCTTGNYLEIGGRDGLDGTNTLFFEQLNWTGMLIEACPDAYLKMVKNRSSKKNIFVHGIISGVNPFTLTKFTSFGKEACSSVATASDDLTYNKYWLSKKKGYSHTHYVMQFPLSAVLNSHSFTRIEFFSLDVEGYELNVLNSIDFSRVRIFVILVEASRFFVLKNTRVRCLLEYLGYSGTIDESLNDIFWLKSMVPKNLRAEKMCHGNIRNGLNWCSGRLSDPFCKDVFNHTSEQIEEQVVAEYCKNYKC